MYLLLRVSLYIKRSIEIVCMYSYIKCEVTDPADHLWFYKQGIKAYLVLRMLAHVHKIMAA